jgi:hypothetical protein
MWGETGLGGRRCPEKVGWPIPCPQRRAHGVSEARASPSNTRGAHCRVGKVPGGRHEKRCSGRRPGGGMCSRASGRERRGPLSRDARPARCRPPVGGHVVEHIRDDGVDHRTHRVERRKQLDPDRAARPYERESRHTIAPAGSSVCERRSQRRPPSSKVWVSLLATLVMEKKTCLPLGSDSAEVSRGLPKLD